jgi:hypothetical protein
VKLYIGKTLTLSDSEQALPKKGRKNCERE